MPASVLATLQRCGDRPGFVVGDMDDVDRFGPIDDVAVPDAPRYLVDRLDRRDAMLGWGPDEHCQRAPP